MFIKSLALLGCASLVLGGSEQGFNSQNPLSVNAGGPAFVALDNGVNAYFQSDGQFVIYNHGTVHRADAVWYSGTVWLSRIHCIFTLAFFRDLTALSAQGGYDCTHDNCNLRFQNDGNFVLYVDDVARWNTTTQGTGFELFFRNQKPYITITDGLGGVVWSTSP